MSTEVGVQRPDGAQPNDIDTGRYAVAGDGIIDDGEECDDGNVDDRDGCSANGLIEPGYICTDERARRASAARPWRRALPWSATHR